MSAKYPKRVEGTFYIDKHYDLVYCYLGIVNQRGARVPCYAAQKFDSGLLLREDYISKEALLSILTNNNSGRVLAITGTYPDLLRVYAPSIKLSADECTFLRRCIGVQRAGKVNKEGTDVKGESSRVKIDKRVNLKAFLTLIPAPYVLIEYGQSSIGGTVGEVLCELGSKAEGLYVTSCLYNIAPSGLSLRLTVLGYLDD